MKPSVLALSFALGGPLLAQDEARVQLMYPSNQRVRVTAPEVFRHAVVGRVATVDSSHLTLTVTRGGTALAIPYGSIARLDASAGVDRRKGRIRGALVGLGFGTWFFADTYPEIREGDYFGFGFLAVSLVSFVITPGIGAFAGHFLAPEAWEALRVPAASSVAAGAASVRFAANEHVRLRTRNERYSGPVVSQTRSLVTLSTDRGRVPVSWDDVTKVTVRGEPSRRRGAARGAIIITGITAIGIATDPLPTAIENVGVVLSNAAFGALVGAFFPARGWMDVPVPRPAR